MAGNRFYFLILFSLLFFACGREDRPAEQPSRKPEPTVILKPKPKLMSPEQRKELGFPDEIIGQVEDASEALAEPFFEDVMMRTANLRGDVMIAGSKLSGFSVRTSNADEVIGMLSPSFRKRGFLIFRSGQNYGNVPDIVSVVRGSSSYDILKIQKTEASNYHLGTKEIIAWLKKQQQFGAFVVTGAGADWVEARFITPPKKMGSFARKVAAFAPDVLTEHNGSVDRLAERMKRLNGFALWWD